ncbi:metal-dependent transcriptional regulator [Nesterenkonia alkaliphila]|uniref:Dihydrofolate reductase n=1 Tax=Nesterenkonia alkaliphila TaxID=1463631 RepID=A0A7K1UFR0_9MICC|nr:metal-dependent transcriptional regulator [Nesterenkonia alkaliphila]MVT25224.1 dihydrofolate reductase [Nesterenkonia alkaliphila]GFZ94973.1 DtxR family transcriptional regulator [Nesterenkonia alkaliphila]
MTDLIDTTEMYLRTILDLEEEGIVPLRARIAERLEHSGPTVSQTVARMERDGLLRLTESRQLELTEAGRGLAVQVMRKHRLAERLLSDVIGLEWPYIHEEACRWEHVMSERVERRLVELLDDPVESPYGNPIPGLEQLGVTGAHPSMLARKTLREAAEEYDAAAGPTPWKVQRLAESIQVEPEVLEQLLEVGLRPGVPVEVTGLTEAYALLTVEDPEQGRLEVELPLEVAQHIFVNER